MKIAIILGTSRQDSNTRQFVNKLLMLSGATLFDLSNYDISFYDYENKNRNDDFLPLVQELMDFEHIVLASPIYWYCVSAQLKVFIDRLSDLLTIEKDLGRQLKGKSSSLLSTGNDEKCPDCFITPIEQTLKYMHIEFKGCDYVSINSKADWEKLAKAADIAFKKMSS
jgi:multimeric flavodoxin WrbA